MKPVTKLKWWQTAVFYQIYPRSFADGNGDGIGDFKGMIDRLDYLQDLGVEALWLSPHYPSPLVDCGYDISDYTGVAPEYGTLDDFKQFLDGAHRRGLRVILDLVLNHTSDQHPWFIESRSSRDNPKRDWYVWRDGRNGGPPTNWHSYFSDSAWEYDPTTQQYYYHIFFSQQPDLNWRNPQVKQAIFEAARFWLDLGVDGFRLDAIDTVFENPALPDYTANQTPRDMLGTMLTNYPNLPDAAMLADQTKLFEQVFKYQTKQPGVHELMQELRALVDQYPDRVLVGETEEISFYGNGSNELHMVFNFPLMNSPTLTPAVIRANQAERLAALPPAAWPCNTLGNHDESRMYNRYGNGRHNQTLARLHLALMLTLPGTPFLYNGEEIGMSNWPVTDVSQFRDNVSHWVYQIAINEFGVHPAEALQLAVDRGRDKCRTPLQWANAANAGFSPTEIQPWLPVNPDYAQGVNVAGQLKDPGSLLHFYRQLLHLRRQTPALIAGDYYPLHQTAPDYLAFLRRTQAQTCLVILNMSDQAYHLRFDLGAGPLRRVFSSSSNQAAEAAPTQLAIDPFEIYIGVLNEAGLTGNAD